METQVVNHRLFSRGKVVISGARFVKLYEQDMKRNNLLTISHYELYLLREVDLVPAPFSAKFGRNRDVTIMGYLVERKGRVFICQALGAQRWHSADITHASRAVDVARSSR